MQKHDVPLAGDEEERVSQLSELRHHEEVDPESADIIRSGEAHGGHESLLHDEESNLHDSSHDADVGEKGKGRVPGKEGPLQVHWLPCLHVVLTGVYAGQVGYDCQVRQLGTSERPFLVMDDVSVALKVRVEEVTVTVARVIDHCFLFLQVQEVGRSMLRQDDDDVVVELIERSGDLRDFSRDLRRISRACILLSSGESGLLMRLECCPGTLFISRRKKKTPG